MNLSSDFAIADRPQPRYPLVEARGRLQVAGGMMLAIILPCLAVLLVIVILVSGLVAGLDFGAIMLNIVIIGGIVLFTFGLPAIIALPLGIRLIRRGREALATAQQLTTEGVWAQAVIVDCWTQQWKRPRQYCIAYRFEDVGADGPRLITHAEINQEAYLRYQTGMRVPVRYLPNAPEVCRIDLDFSD
jgi:fumarate reductase subunit D